MRNENKAISDEFKAWIAPMLIPKPVLPEGMQYTNDMQPGVYCSCCGNLFEWPLGVDEYDQNDNYHHYCGASPRCCP